VRAVDFAAAIRRRNPRRPMPEPSYIEYPKPVLPKIPPRLLLPRQTAIVTGSSSGIGRAVAIELAHAGANVCVNYASTPEQAAGKIICMSSVHEVIPWAGHVNYATSKGGIMLMMKSIAQEVAPWRIRVNSIAPGAIRTPINTGAWDTPEHYAALMKLIPYKRI